MGGLRIYEAEDNEKPTELGQLGTGRGTAIKGTPYVSVKINEKRQEVVQVVR